MDKAHILNSIETADSYSHLPVNVLTPVNITVPPVSPVAPTASQPISAQPAGTSPLMNRMMTAPVATANEKVEKRAPGPDPYREPIE